MLATCMWLASSPACALAEAVPIAAPSCCALYVVRFEIELRCYAGGTYLTTLDLETVSLGVLVSDDGILIA